MEEDQRNGGIFAKYPTIEGDEPGSEANPYVTGDDLYTPFLDALTKGVQRKVLINMTHQGVTFVFTPSMEFKIISYPDAGKLAYVEDRLQQVVDRIKVETGYNEQLSRPGNNLGQSLKHFIDNLTS